ncbi:hypothetical protein [Aliiruegeria sabulilitoris]|uniref:hypothetical protein n=1 Tax=Aliiruegeria sabulilitoris TaxID=1510458 RepID=UPI00082DDDCE|nr:hypothetical protein [Aliiruegeria sabulilitoris]NDR55300.1 hypothetical protein [Pseudoruegeria sp. M32A2M]
MTDDQVPRQLTLPPDLQAQITKLILAIPRPRYSDTVRQMLLDHGLVTEDELAEFRGDSLSTIQAYRARGQMPPYFKWGSLICYRTDDIAALITGERIENAAYKRRKASNADLLGQPTT